MTEDGSTSSRQRADTSRGLRRSSTLRLSSALRRSSAGLGLALLTLALTACPRPEAEKLDFDTDPRILRGPYAGYVDTRRVPHAMAIAGDASLLAMAWPDSLELRNPATSELVATLDPPSDEELWRVELSIDATGTLVAGILNYDVALWSGHDGQLVRTFDVSGLLTACEDCGPELLSISPTGGSLAVAGRTPGILVLDTTTGELARELETAGDEVGLVAFSAGGELLLSASRISTIGYALRVWDASTYEVVFEREGPLGWSRGPQFAFSADGRRLAVGSEDKVEVFDIAGGAAELPLELPLDQSVETWLRSLNPDGTQVGLVSLARESDLYMVRIVDVATGGTLAQFPHPGTVASLWSADGRYLIAGSQLVAANDFSVVHDYAVGQYYALQLDVEAHYVNPRTYDVSGTVSIDGATAVGLSGTVYGNDAQRYLQPQYSLPQPAALRLTLEARPWYLRAAQYGSTWLGTMREIVDEEELSSGRFELRRAP